MNELDWFRVLKYTPSNIFTNEFFNFQKNTQKNNMINVPKKKKININIGTDTVEDFQYFLEIFYNYLFLYKVLTQI